jgi:hypothetical protein
MTCRTAWGLGLAELLLVACASSPGTTHAPTRPAPPTPAVRSDAAGDGSFDWHALARMPFGTLLKDSPIALHEVLLFHEAERGATDTKDCYAMDAAAPRFLGSQPDDYVLCFDHDRLVRIEASVPLPAAEAPAVFARGCARWLKNATPPQSDTCEGRDDGVSFSGRLAGISGEATARVTMTLTSAADLDAVRDPPRTAPREP